MIDTANAAATLTSRLEIAAGPGAYLGDTRVRLLEAIDRQGSITQAARQVGLSYKAAWDAVDAMNNLTAGPLVESTAGGRAGGGTTLTPQGRRLVAMYRALDDDMQQSLARLQARMPDLQHAEVRDFRRLLRQMALRTSARNQFAGRVSGLIEGPVDFEVRVRVDDAVELVAVVTPTSVRALGLAIGSEVVALVKASSVLLHTGSRPHSGERNQLWGEVRQIALGPVHAEVVLDLGGGRSAVAVVPAELPAALQLQPGVRACAAFKVSSVVIAMID